MKRIVKPELLDELPADDPRAIRSRRDLRRVNTWMRNHVIMANALQTAVNGRPPKNIVELGAGDGDFLLRVAQKIYPCWPGATVTLLDRQPGVSGETLALFASFGWCAETVVADVFDWADNRERGRLTGVESAGRQDAGAPGRKNGVCRQDAGAPGVVIANLFLHHFEDTRLKELLRMIAGRARSFVAIEPRRARWPLFCCRWLWVIGCNSVTRHDAAVSVRAGFAGNELSALWPAGANWQLVERRAGPFSHLFVAQRNC